MKIGGFDLNWIKAFNLMQSKYDEKMYEKATEYFEEFDAVLSPLERKFGELLTQLMEDIKCDEIEKKIEFINVCFEEGRDTIDEIEAHYREYRIKLNGDFKLNINSLCDDVLDYVNSHRDFLLLKKRVLVYIKQTSVKLSSLLKELFEGAVWFYREFVLELKKITVTLGEEFSGLIDSEEEEDEDIILTTNNANDFEIKKIFNYKEMEDLAKSRNFAYKWSNGSHRIYENPDTNKIVVIPSHELGLGLSVKIQKQIMSV